jgi:hypothetical protein
VCFLLIIQYIKPSIKLIAKELKSNNLERSPKNSQHSIQKLQRNYGIGWRRKRSQRAYSTLALWAGNWINQDEVEKTPYSFLGAARKTNWENEEESSKVCEDITVDSRHRVVSYSRTYWRHSGCSAGHWKESGRTKWQQG